MLDFQQLIRPNKPNNYLLADKEDSPRTRADTVSPVFHASADEVCDALLAVMYKLPRTTLVDSDDNTNQYEFIQKSFLFKFPDTISALVIATGEKEARLVVYSSSKFGYSDLGVNRKRVSRIVYRMSDILASNRVELLPL